MSSTPLSEQSSSTSLSHPSDQSQPIQKESLSERQLEALYALGFELYSTDNFQKAADLFRLLCVCEPQKTRNWMALGGANQNKKDYRAAAAAFLMAALEEPLNPEPRLCLAHSFIDLMDLSAALDSVKKALELSENRGDKKELYERALLLYQALETHLQSMR